MWEEIDRLVSVSACRLSVYADDITISGKLIPERLIWDIKKMLYRHGHKYKVSKERSRHEKPAEITGVILRKDRLHAPNRQHLSLHKVRRDLALSRSEESRKKLGAQLIGREAQLKQIIGLERRLPQI